MYSLTYVSSATGDLIALQLRKLLATYQAVSGIVAAFDAGQVSGC